VIGLDSLNHYYDPNLKEARLGQLKSDSNFSFEKIDLADRAATLEIAPECYDPAASADSAHLEVGDYATDVAYSEVVERSFRYRSGMHTQNASLSGASAAM
jgi:hypothetical protein